MKFRHSTLIVISGLTWLAIGSYLLFLGLTLLLNSTLDQSDKIYPIVSNLAPYVGGTEQVGLFLAALFLGVGYMKSKYVLSRTVLRTLTNICSSPNPSGLGTVYNRQYIMLIGAMAMLGAGIKFLQLPDDIRGSIDIAIGSALINGSVLYFKSCKTSLA